MRKVITSVLISYSFSFLGVVFSLLYFSIIENNFSDKLGDYIYFYKEKINIFDTFFYPYIIWIFFTGFIFYIAFLPVIVLFFSKFKLFFLTIYLFPQIWFFVNFCQTCDPDIFWTMIVGTAWTQIAFLLGIYIQYRLLQMKVDATS